jgi:hypothetical protein
MTYTEQLIYAFAIFTLGLPLVVRLGMAIGNHIWRKPLASLERVLPVARAMAAIGA